MARCPSVAMSATSMLQAVRRNDGRDPIQKAETVLRNDFHDRAALRKFPVEVNYPSEPTKPFFFLPEHDTLVLSREQRVQFDFLPQ